MKKQTIAALTAVMLLTACGEKDAEYYYNHPDELKPILAACEERTKGADDATLTALKADKECLAVGLAAAGIQLGDYKKAVMEEEKYGWAAYVQGILDAKQKLKNDYALLEQIEKMDPKEAQNKLLDNFFRCPAIGASGRSTKPKENEKDLCDKADKLYNKTLEDLGIKPGFFN